MTAVTENALLVIGGRPETLRSALDLGLRVVNIQIPEYASLAHSAQLDATVLADYTDWDVLAPLATYLVEQFGITRVVSMTEPGLLPAGMLRDRLGLAGNSAIVSRRLKDKLLMRRRLVGSGLVEVPAARYEGRQSLARFGADHGYPFVVKPSDATASLHVRIVRSPSDLEETAAFVDAAVGSAGHRYAKVFPLTTFMMEGYVDGPEYSVETLSFAGRHVVVAVTEKLTTGHGVEIGHAVPGRLPSADAEAVVDDVTRFLDVMGLVDGPSHTEVRISSAGPVVIESHDRSGGDRIIDLVRQVYGVDFEQYTVGWPTGRLPALDGPPGARGAAATRFLTVGPGVVSAVQGVAKAESLPYCLAVHLEVAVGDVVHELRGNWDRVGQVLARGADAAEALRHAEDIAQTIEILTEGCP